MRASVQFRATRPSTRKVRNVTVEISDPNFWPHGGVAEVQRALQTLARSTSMLYSTYRLNPSGPLLTPLESLPPSFETDGIVVLAAAADQMRLPSGQNLSSLTRAVSVSKLVARLLPIEEILLASVQAMELLSRQVLTPFGLPLRRYCAKLRLAADLARPITRLEDAFQRIEAAEVALSVQNGVSEVIIPVQWTVRHESNEFSENVTAWVILESSDDAGCVHVTFGASRWDGSWGKLLEEEVDEVGDITMRRRLRPALRIEDVNLNRARSALAHLLLSSSAEEFKLEHPTLLFAVADELILVLDELSQLNGEHMTELRDLVATFRSSVMSSARSDVEYAADDESAGSGAAEESSELNIVMSDENAPDTADVTNLADEAAEAAKISTRKVLHVLWRLMRVSFVRVLRRPREGAGSWLSLFAEEAFYAATGCDWLLPFEHLICSTFFQYASVLGGSMGRSWGDTLCAAVWIIADAAKERGQVQPYGAFMDVPLDARHVDHPAAQALDVLECICYDQFTAARYRLLREVVFFQVSAAAHNILFADAFRILALGQRILKRVVNQQDVIFGGIAGGNLVENLTRRICELDAIRTLLSDCLAPSRNRPWLEHLLASRASVTSGMPAPKVHPHLASMGSAPVRSLAIAGRDRWMYAQSSPYSTRVLDYMWGASSPRHYAPEDFFESPLLKSPISDLRSFDVAWMMSHLSALNEMGAAGSAVHEADLRGLLVHFALEVLPMPPLVCGEPAPPLHLLPFVAQLVQLFVASSLRQFGRDALDSYDVFKRWALRPRSFVAIWSLLAFLDWVVRADLRNRGMRVLALDLQFFETTIAYDECFALEHHSCSRRVLYLLRYGHFSRSQAAGALNLNLNAGRSALWDLFSWPADPIDADAVETDPSEQFDQDILVLFGGLTEYEFAVVNTAVLESFRRAVVTKTLTPGSESMESLLEIPDLGISNRVGSQMRQMQESVSHQRMRHFMHIERRNVDIACCKSYSRAGVGGIAKIFATIFDDSDASDSSSENSPEKSAALANASSRIQTFVDKVVAPADVVTQLSFYWEDNVRKFSGFKVMVDLVLELLRTGGPCSLALLVMICNCVDLRSRYMRDIWALRVADRLLTGSDARFMPAVRARLAVDEAIRSSGPLPEEIYSLWNRFLGACETVPNPLDLAKKLRRTVLVPALDRSQFSPLLHDMELKNILNLHIQAFAARKLAVAPLPIEQLHQLQLACFLSPVEVQCRVFGDPIFYGIRSIQLARIVLCVGHGRSSSIMSSVAVLFGAGLSLQKQDMSRFPEDDDLRREEINGGAGKSGRIAKRKSSRLKLFHLLKKHRVEFSGAVIVDVQIAFRTIPKLMRMIADHAADLRYSAAGLMTVLTVNDLDVGVAIFLTSGHTDSAKESGGTPLPDMFRRAFVRGHFDPDSSAARWTPVRVLCGLQATIPAFDGEPVLQASLLFDFLATHWVRKEGIWDLSQPAEICPDHLGLVSVEWNDEERIREHMDDSATALSLLMCALHGPRLDVFLSEPAMRRAVAVHVFRPGALAAAIGRAPPAVVESLFSQLDSALSVASRRSSAEMLHLRYLVYRVGLVAGSTERWREAVKKRQMFHFADFLVDIIDNNERDQDLVQRKIAAFYWLEIQREIRMLPVDKDSLFRMVFCHHLVQSWARASALEVSTRSIMYPTALAEQREHLVIAMIHSDHPLPELLEYLWKQSGGSGRLNLQSVPATLGGRDGSLMFVVPLFEGGSVQFDLMDGALRRGARELLQVPPEYVALPAYARVFGGNTHIASHCVYNDGIESFEIELDSLVFNFLVSAPPIGSTPRGRRALRRRQVLGTNVLSSRAACVLVRYQSQTYVHVAGSILSRELVHVHDPRNGTMLLLPSQSHALLEHVPGVCLRSEAWVSTHDTSQALLADAVRPRDLSYHVKIKSQALSKVRALKFNKIVVHTLSLSPKYCEGVAQQLIPLEHPAHIEVAPGVLMLLPRYNLLFRCQEKAIWTSPSYRGLRLLNSAELPTVVFGDSSQLWIELVSMDSPDRVLLVDPGAALTTAMPQYHSLKWQTADAAFSASISTMLWVDQQPHSVRDRVLVTINVGSTGELTSHDPVAILWLAYAMMAKGDFLRSEQNIVRSLRGTVEYSSAMMAVLKLFFEWPDADVQVSLLKLKALANLASADWNCLKPTHYLSRLLPVGLLLRCLYEVTVGSTKASSVRLTLEERLALRRAVTTAGLNIPDGVTKRNKSPHLPDLLGTSLQRQHDTFFGRSDIRGGGDDDGAEDVPEVSIVDSLLRAMFLSSGKKGLRASAVDELLRHRNVAAALLLNFSASTFSFKNIKQLAPYIHGVPPWRFWAGHFCPIYRALSDYCSSVSGRDVDALRDLIVLLLQPSGGDRVDQYSRLVLLRFALFASALGDQVQAKMPVLPEPSFSISYLKIINQARHHGIIARDVQLAFDKMNAAVHTTAGLSIDRTACLFGSVVDRVSNTAMPSLPSFTISALLDVGVGLHSISFNDSASQLRYLSGNSPYFYTNTDGVASVLALLNVSKKDPSAWRGICSEISGHLFGDFQAGTPYFREAARLCDGFQRSWEEMARCVELVDGSTDPLLQIEHIISVELDYQKEIARCSEAALREIVRQPGQFLNCDKITANTAPSVDRILSMWENGVLEVEPGLMGGAQGVHAQALEVELTLCRIIHSENLLRILKEIAMLRKDVTGSSKVKQLLSPKLDQFVAMVQQRIPYPERLPADVHVGSPQELLQRHVLALCRSVRYLVRAQQLDVANDCIDHPGGVLQAPLGSGKSSVVVPLVAIALSVPGVNTLWIMCTLADKRATLGRVAMSTTALGQSMYVAHFKNDGTDNPSTGRAHGGEIEGSLRRFPPYDLDDVVCLGVLCSDLLEAKRSHGVVVSTRESLLYLCGRFQMLAIQLAESAVHPPSSSDGVLLEKLSRARKMYGILAQVLRLIQDSGQAVLDEVDALLNYSEKVNLAFDERVNVNVDSLRIASQFVSWLLDPREMIAPQDGGQLAIPLSAVVPLMDNLQASVSPSARQWIRCHLARLYSERQLHVQPDTEKWASLQAFLLGGNNVSASALDPSLATADTVRVRELLSGAFATLFMRRNVAFGRMGTAHDNPDDVGPYSAALSPVPQSHLSSEFDWAWALAVDYACGGLTHSQVRRVLINLRDGRELARRSGDRISLAAPTLLDQVESQERKSVDEVLASPAALKRVADRFNDLGDFVDCGTRDWCAILGAVHKPKMVWKRLNLQPESLGPYSLAALTPVVCRDYSTVLHNVNFSMSDEVILQYTGGVRFRLEFLSQHVQLSWSPLYIEGTAGTLVSMFRSSLGFSGTLHFPQALPAVVSPVRQDSLIDGRVLYNFVCNAQILGSHDLDTTRVLERSLAESSVAKALLRSVETKDCPVLAIVDSGALFVQRPEEVASDLLNAHRPGVSRYDSVRWKELDSDWKRWYVSNPCASPEIMDKQSNVDTVLTYFDQQHSRGTDTVLKYDARMVNTVGDDTQLSHWMQGEGRARGNGLGQVSVSVVAPSTAVTFEACGVRSLGVRMIRSLLRHSADAQVSQTFYSHADMLRGYGRDALRRVLVNNPDPLILGPLLPILRDLFLTRATLDLSNPDVLRATLVPQPQGTALDCLDEVRRIETIRLVALLPYASGSSCVAGALESAVAAVRNHVLPAKDSLPQAERLDLPRPGERSFGMVVDVQVAQQSDAQMQQAASFDVDLQRVGGFNAAMRMRAPWVNWPPSWPQCAVDSLIDRIERAEFMVSVHSVIPTFLSARLYISRNLGLRCDDEIQLGDLHREFIEPYQYVLILSTASTHVTVIVSTQEVAQFVSPILRSLEKGNEGEMARLYRYAGGACGWVLMDAASWDSMAVTHANMRPSSTLALALTRAAVQIGVTDIQTAEELGGWLQLMSGFGAPNLPDALWPRDSRRRGQMLLWRILDGRDTFRALKDFAVDRKLLEEQFGGAGMPAGSASSLLIRRILRINRARHNRLLGRQFDKMPLVRLLQFFRDVGAEATGEDDTGADSNEDDNISVQTAVGFINLASSVRGCED